MNRLHPLLRLTFFGPFAAILLIRSGAIGGLSAWQWLVDLMAGLALWTLLEYVLHRFVFHYVPRSKRLRDLQLHIHHHADPTDPHTNVTPLTFSVPLTLLVWGGLVFAARSLEHGTVACVGTIIGYISYELIHFSTHLSRLNGGLFRYWRSYHFEHHKHPDICYGFTSPLWDIVFHTRQRRRRSHTASETGWQGRFWLR
jgi:dihydroceramide fatty acyl 2-hydroxylase